jgi:mRNA-degrading endonuclease RelE of RelBE toxin-antitoxin system
MEVNILAQAADDLDRMDNNAYLFFVNHIKKIAQMPPRRHMKFGMPFNVEEIGQGRIVYQVKEEKLFIIRCFADHKDYEKWYRSKK